MEQLNSLMSNVSIRPNIWIPKLPEEYYGPIPQIVDLEELKQILASGIIKYTIDLATNTGIAISSGDMYSILTKWCESDRLTSLIPELEMDDYFRSLD